jgi:DNA-binding GntR family transcriptional regulator
VSPQELEQLYDMREVIEPYAAERAARLASPAQLEQLRAVCDEITAIAKQPGLAQWLESAKQRR